MSAILDETDLTTPQINGAKRWRRDIPHVDQLTSFQQDYIVVRTNFSPEPLDTAHPDEPGFYLVDESPLRPLSGGIVEFTREYALIPDGHFVPEQYAWYLPGMGSEDPPGPLVNINAATVSGGLVTFTTSADHSATAGDQVQVKYTVSTHNGDVTRTVLRTVTAGSGSSLTCAAIFESYPITYLSLQQINPGRDPEVLPVPSKLQVDYFLPGVNVTSFDAIPILVEYANIMDSTGRRTRSFTDSTTPTLSEYRAVVAAETEIVIVRSALERWKGNIFQRSTRYAKAI